MGPMLKRRLVAWARVALVLVEDVERVVLRLGAHHPVAVTLARIDAAAIERQVRSPRTIRLTWSPPTKSHFPSTNTASGSPQAR